MADSEPDTTRDLEEARHWLTLYRELIAVEERTLLEALRRVQRFAGQGGGQQMDAPGLSAFKERLTFWEERYEQLLQERARFEPA